MAAGQQVTMPEISWIGCACEVIAWNAIRVTRASPDKQPHDVAAIFDAVTISFALRNVHDYPRGLAEMLRVTKPGGRVIVCEFSRPTLPAFSKVCTAYLMKAFPSVPRAVSSNPDSYVYLAESIQAWPDQQGLATEIGRSGWRSVVEWRNLTGGIVALHRAIRPA
jgi:demethylmenaquinone methyltransferase/2-methoxy-6-polyprenyl-1,4-benzoquinol methylase